MGEVIVITSGKGGVGKTTTTANIGIGLSSAGKKVLVIDKRNHIAGNIYTENVEGMLFLDLKIALSTILLTSLKANVV